MKKLLLVAILMLALVFTVVACNNDKPDNDTTVGETTVEVTPGTTAEPDPDVTDEPVVTEPDTTEAPVTTQAPDTTAEPPTTAPVVTTEPATTEAPVDPAEPVWIIDAAGLADKAAGGNMVAAELNDAGYVHLTSTGGDPYFQFASGLGAMPNYMAIRYRTNTTQNGQFFLGSGGGPNGQGDFFEFAWNGNGEWNLLVFDLSTCGATSITDGVLNYIRFDYFTGGGAEGDYMDVEYIAIFNSAEYAEAYDFELHPPYVEPSAAGLVANSFDTFFVNNEMYFQPDGGHGDKLTAQDNIVAFKAGETHDSISLRGWIGFGQPIASFGYYIDNYQMVYGEFTQATEDGVKAAGGEHASRFKIDVPTADFVEGDHMIGFVVKLEDGTVVRLREEVIVRLPANATNLFQSNASSNEDGTDLKDSDLAGYFEIAYGLGEPHVVTSVDGVLSYKIGTFNAISVMPDGLYALSVKDLATQNPGFSGIFVRALRNANPEGQFYGQDGNDATANSYAGSGIFVALDGADVRINVKSYVDGKYVPNIYKIAAPSNNITVADDGSVVYIISGDKLVATIAVNGTADYGVAGVAADEASASATLSLCDGTVVEIENAILAASCDKANSIGAATRGGGVMSFSEIAVKGFTEVEIPEMVIELPRENIALGKPVSSDSVENATNIPENATDGDESTRFGALPNGEVKLIVDLEDYYALSDMKVVFENASWNYEILVSADGENYTKIYADGPHGATTKKVENLDGIVARYIMFNRLPDDGASSYWFSIYELYVYGEKTDNQPEEPMTPEEIVDAAYGLADGESLEGTYTLTGVITSIDTPYSNQYGNITVTIQVGDMADKLIQCFRLKGEGAADLKVTDTITVTGSLKNYKGTIEFDAGCSLDAVVPGEGPAEPTYTTPEEIVNAAYALEVGASLSKEYTLTGVIISVDTVYSENYKNVTVTMVVGDMTDKPIQCFRLKGEGADVIAVGDTITVTGVLINYNGKIEFNSGCILNSYEPAPIPEPVPGSEELPLVWEGDVEVAGTHDVWYTYTAAEDGILVITYPAGNWISGLANKTDAAYSINVTKGQTVTFNIFGNNEGTYSAKMVKLVDATQDGLCVDEAEVAVDTSVLFLDKGAFAALIHIGSVEIVGDSIQFVYNVNGVVSDPIEAIEATAYSITVPADALKLGGNLIKIGVVIDGLTVEYFWEYTVVVEIPEETETEEPEAPAEPVEGTIHVTTTDTYGFFDLYSFTAPMAGTYTFTVPANLGFYSEASYNAWGPAEADFYENTDGATVTVELAEGEVYSFYVGAITKADWTISYVGVAGEVGGGDEEPETPVADLVLNVGSNDIVFTDADMVEGAISYTFTVTEAGMYAFTSNDLMAIIFFADGSQQRGMAYLEPGTYEIVVVNYAWAAGTYSMNVEYTAPEVSEPSEATISFADHTLRTEEGENYQIFTNGDFVFTQAQGEARNWNTSYIDPIRLYVGHEVTIAYPGMTKIVIDGNSSKPQDGWVDSITDSNATVTVDGTTVTIEFATPVDSFTVTIVSQVRVNAITVYAE
ncbi:MAG: discoidin domain-containing protein [Clostridia bacterium]|nr:discoidin domain-containing protein [Clostridia bacterium]